MRKQYERKKKPFFDTWQSAVLVISFYLSLFVSLIFLFTYLVKELNWDRYELLCSSEGDLNYTIPFYATIVIHYFFIRLPINWFNKRYVRYCVLYGFKYDTVHWKIQEVLLEHIGHQWRVNLNLEPPLSFDEEVERANNVVQEYYGKGRMQQSSSFSKKMNLSDDEIQKYWDKDKNVWTREMRAVFYIYNVLEEIHNSYKEIKPNNEDYYNSHELEKSDDRYNCNDFNCYDIEYPMWVGLRKNKKSPTYWMGIKMGRKHGFCYTAVKEGTILRRDVNSNYSISYHYKINDT